MNSTQQHGPYLPQEASKPPKWSHVVLVALVVFMTVYLLGSFYIHRVGL